MKPFTYYGRSIEYQSLQSSLQALLGPSFFETSKALFFDWFVIASTVTLTLSLRSSPSFYFLYPLSVLVIGARQHALLIMMHDGAHGNLHPDRKINEYISDLLCAFPHFLTTEGYRQDHLAHHRFVGSALDPNWSTKQGLKDWEFPKSKGRIFFLLARDLFGYGFFRIFWFILRYKKLDTKKEDNDGKKEWSRIILRGGYYLFILLAVLYFGVLKEFTMFWMVPFLTVLPALLRMRTLSEHYGLEREHDFNISRNYSCNLLEKFFLSPHNVNYHLDHHLYMTVPFFRVPELHRLLQNKNDYLKLAHQSNGILTGHPNSILSDLTKKWA